MTLLIVGHYFYFVVCNKTFNFKEGLNVLFIGYFVVLRFIFIFKYIYFIVLFFSCRVEVEEVDGFEVVGMEQYLEARKVEEKVLALWLQPDSDKGRQDSLREYKRFKAELNEFKKTKEICWGIKPVSDKKREKNLK